MLTFNVGQYWSQVISGENYVRIRIVPRMDRFKPSSPKQTEKYTTNNTDSESESEQNEELEFFGKNY